MKKIVVGLLLVVSIFAGLPGATLAGQLFDYAQGKCIVPNGDYHNKACHAYFDTRITQGATKNDAIKACQDYCNNKVPTFSPRPKLSCERGCAHATDLDN